MESTVDLLAVTTATVGFVVVVVFLLLPKHVLLVSTAKLYSVLLLILLSDTGLLLMTQSLRWLSFS